MRAIKIGNDIKIEWELRVEGDIADVGALDFSVWVFPSKHTVNWRNYTEHPMLYRNEEKVFMNGGLGMLPPHDGRPAHVCGAEK